MRRMSEYQERAALEQAENARIDAESAAAKAQYHAENENFEQAKKEAQNAASAAIEANTQFYLILEFYHDPQSVAEAARFYEQAEDAARRAEKAIYSAILKIKAKAERAKR